MYRLTEGKNFRGWRADADGLVRIPFYINPGGYIGSELTEDDVEAAILASVRNWEGASPRLRFVYEGRTTRDPTIGDGFNDFSLGGYVLHRNENNYRVEADIMFTGGTGVGYMAHDPCEKRDGSCTDTGRSYGDAEDLATHEIGHVLGLGDLGGDDPDARWLTMMNYPSAGERHRTTLALGDVLGIRHVYPCGCPLPPIYDP